MHVLMIKILTYKEAAVQLAKIASTYVTRYLNCKGLKLLGGMIHGQLDKQLKYKKFGYLPKHYRKSFKNFAIANVLINEGNNGK